MTPFRFAAALAVLVLALSGPAGAAGRFFSAVEDLPLMPGLIEQPDAAVSFEKPQGRIVELHASGQVTRKQVAAFYARVLPQLGWVKAADGSFRRESERLRFAFAPAKGAPGRLAVRISISPE